MSYEDEYRSALERIDDDNNKGVRSLRFFLNTTERWHALFQDDHTNTARTTPMTAASPLVVLMGHGVPEQVIYACGTTPLHLLGGSRASCHWSDDAVPRDSDPASRSILGYALRLAENPDLDPLFVVPISGDNMRKIAYLLMREGHKTLPVDIPPTMANESSQRAWERSIHNLVQTVERHVGKRATARSIRKAEKTVAAARAAMVEFDNACIECTGTLDTEARLLVLNSYYQTQDLAQWTVALRELTAETRARYRTMGRPTSNAPRVLVVGSPILFPQFKVANLLDNAGLRLLAVADATSTSRYSKLTERERRANSKRLIDSIARKHYSMDASGSHVVNQAMEEYLDYLLRSMRVDGVIFHILKGQIEHDFTYARMEPVLERYDIPVFRLETDYQYQDVEQLRIRMEAFAEMLQQRTFVPSRANARRSA